MLVGKGIRRPQQHARHNSGYAAAGVAVPVQLRRPDGLLVPTGLPSPGAGTTVPGHARLRLRTVWLPAGYGGHARRTHLARSTSAPTAHWTDGTTPTTGIDGGRLSSTAIPAVEPLPPGQHPRHLGAVMGVVQDADEGPPPSFSSSSSSSFGRRKHHRMSH